MSPSLNATISVCSVKFKHNALFVIFLLECTLCYILWRISQSRFTGYWYIRTIHTLFNTLKPGQNGRHFADDLFKYIPLNWNVEISIKISLEFVPKAPFTYFPALVQIMLWRRSRDKPLSKPIIFSLLRHICVSRPQWVIGNESTIIMNLWGIWSMPELNARPTFSIWLALCEENPPVIVGFTSQKASAVERWCYTHIIYIYNIYVHLINVWSFYVFNSPTPTQNWRLRGHLCNSLYNHYQVWRINRFNWYDCFHYFAVALSQRCTITSCQLLHIDPWELDIRCHYCAVCDVCRLLNTLRPKGRIRSFAYYIILFIIAVIQTYPKALNL